MNQSHPIICRITMGTSLDVDTITQFQVNMAHESEGTILDYDKVHKGVSAVVNVCGGAANFWRRKKH